MSIDPKQIKKLAAMCRKAGITHFKSAEFEFTLSDTAPQAPKKSKKVESPSAGPDQIDTDSLTPEELLFWSTGVVEQIAKDQ